MEEITYEEIYEIIKTNGPMSLQDIRTHLVKQNRLTLDGLDSLNSKISGYIGALSRNNFIEKVKNKIPKLNSLRKIEIEPNIWRILRTKA